MQGQKHVFESFFLEQVKYLTLFDLFQVAEYLQWNTILESLKIKNRVIIINYSSSARWIWDNKGSTSDNQPIILTWKY